MIIHETYVRNMEQKHPKHDGKSGKAPNSKLGFCLADETHPDFSTSENPMGKALRGKRCRKNLKNDWGWVQYVSIPAIK